MNSSHSYNQIETQNPSQVYPTSTNPTHESAVKKPECPKPDSKRPSDDTQTHVHEFQGSTKLAEMKKERHNHRFAGVSGQVIPFGNSHVHAIFTNTDFFDDHLHEIGGISGPAIPVEGGVNDRHNLPLSHHQILDSLINVSISPGEISRWTLRITDVDYSLIRFFPFNP